jgi:hypothetical protein
MKKQIEVADIAVALQKQLEEGGAFDTHIWETTGHAIADDGVKLLANRMQVLVIFANDQVFELTVRVRERR